VLVVNNYLVLLYNNLGLKGWLPLLLYAIYDLWAAIMNFVNSLLLDRLGRIRILTVGLIGCGVMMIIETAMVANYAGTANRTGNAMGVLFLFLYVTFYGGSLDAGSYVYCAEIFPTGIRAQGLGMSVASLFASTLLYTEVAPVAFAKIGWKYYLVFIIVPLLGVGFVARFFPETKGLTLEEIAAKFGDEVAVDISHLTEEQRRVLDERLAAADDGLEQSPNAAAEAPVMETSQDQKVVVAHSEKE
jgi:MFS family permease